VNQILLNKPNTELSGFVRKKKQKNGTGGIRTPVTGVAARNAAN